ncbi:hypothetical protein Clacol_007890 [Clathrus columnatus]|uniref:DUF6534 domain-containing protein n=1 Tax=Clathrus columnatus TaxID=1419009 RepID=A0AAV5AG69_9AGAM|nr:hypothetical protein Clacol_007890 [Clathrus columnatus]
MIHSGLSFLVIALLWIFDTIQQALVIHALYFYMVLNYANPAALANPIWSIVAQILAATTSDTLVRGIYAICIWRCFTIFQLAGKGKLHFEEVHHVAWLLYTSLATAAAADACIAAFLCWQLYTKRTGFKSTDSIVKTLITFTINTGLIMTLASTAVFISVCFLKKTKFPSKPLTHHCRIYINSLLASLNARDYIRNQRKSTTIINTNAATAGLPSFTLSTTNNIESHSMTTSPSGQTTSVVDSLANERTRQLESTKNGPG